MGDAMKKKVYFILLSILLCSCICFGIFIKFENEKIKENTIIVSTLVDNSVHIDEITKLQEEYNTNELVATLEIQNTDYKTVIMQGSDNDYYLNHMPDGTYKFPGSIFLDYRVSVNDSDILLIYGHSSFIYDLPYEIIENYYYEDFYKEHKYVILNTKNGERKYEVVSAYVETEDFDYMKIEFDSKEERLEHLNKLKEKSNYDTGVNFDKDDNILILQTCSTNSRYYGYSKSYMLVILKEVF